MTETTRTRNLWKPIALIVMVVGLFVAATTFDVAAELERLRGWIDSLRAWGPLVFIMLYVAATIAMVPGSGPAVIAGGLFGAVAGTFYVSVASTIGALACFLIARYFARDAVAGWLRGRERFRKLDRLTETHGGWIVAITRLVPIFPFNLLNYGFGLTRVRTGTYIFFSWVCMLPGTVLYVTGGDAVARAIEEGRIPWTLTAVVAVVFFALIGIGYVAKRRLRSTEGEETGVGREGAG